MKKKTQEEELFELEQQLDIPYQNRFYNVTEKLKEAHKNYCHYCEAYLETDWKYCPYCGKKQDRSATKLGGKQPDSVKQKISKSIKEMWKTRKLNAR